MVDVGLLGQWMSKSVGVTVDELFKLRVLTGNEGLSESAQRRAKNFILAFRLSHVHKETRPQGFIRRLAKVLLTARATLRVALAGIVGAIFRCTTDTGPATTLDFVAVAKIAFRCDRDSTRLEHRANKIGLTIRIDGSVLGAQYKSSVGEGEAKDISHPKCFINQGKVLISVEKLCKLQLSSVERLEAGPLLRFLRG